MVDYREDIRARQGDPAARRRGVPQDSATCCACWWRISTTSIRRPTRCRAARMLEIDRWAMARYAAVASQDRAGVRRLRLPDGLSGGERVHHRRPERVLRRRDEGPDVHVRRRSRKRGARVRRRCTSSSTDWRGCWRRFCRSRWTRCGATCRASARPSVHLARLPAGPGAVAGRRAARAVGRS